MPTLYRIRLKIVDGGKTYTGERIVDCAVREYLEAMHRQHRDATYIYLELLEEFEHEEDEQTDDSSGMGVIIMSLTTHRHDSKLARRTQTPIAMRG